MLLPRVDRWLLHWAHDSQLGSRRNAMLAATALARRRIERQDVDTFIAAREARADVAATTRAAEVTVLMR